VTPGGLDLQQAPPFNVPLRFFLTAPLFALLAAVLALWHGPELFDSRWSPAMLAATHLLALGFAGMVMVGALMQVLPVLAGAPIPHPRLVALLVHPTLSLGTLALAAGFLSGESALLQVALVLLALSFTVFLLAVAASLTRVGIANETVSMLRYSSVALAVTVILGLWLAAARAGTVAIPDASMREIHPAWGFLGWWALLLLALARQVVPMFQMTPPYPAWMSRAFAAAMLVALAAWSLATWGGASGFALVAAGVLAGLYTAFAATTLWLQQKRRRRQPDVTVEFWRAAMVCGIAAPLLWGTTHYAAEPRLAVAAGVLVIIGAAGSAINGMLYRIIPFLAWFHLQALTGTGRRVPHVRQYLGAADQWRQFWLHLAALVLLLAAAAAPGVFAYPAALALAASSAQLLVNVVKMALAYRAAAQELPAAAQSGSC
jgi:hypothetical protein